MVLMTLRRVYLLHLSVGLTCLANSGYWGYFQLAIDESANIMLAIRYYEAGGDTCTSFLDNVAV